MLKIVPIKQKEANYYICKHHRHHTKIIGSIFQIAVMNNEEIVGVIIVGRPVNRNLDNGYTLEVNRCCTNGTKNACSKLYSAAWNVTKNLGYNRLITYTLKSEIGTSLLASNWKILYTTKGGSWNTKKRPRVDKFPTVEKTLWEIQ